jgi:multidrug efflux pump subunit AcrA (membrane-fusion protein)
MHPATFGLVVFLSITGPSDGVGPTPAGGQTLVRHCLISAIEDVEVPAHEAGPLVAIAISEGDWVREGQVLAQIDDRLATLDRQAAEKRREAARAQAEEDIEIRYAVASLEVAEAELTQNLEINRRSPGSVPEADIRRLRLTKHRAELQIDKTRLDRKVAQMTAAVEDVVVRTTEESIARRRIVSPINGVVISVQHDRGEWVKVGDPVARIVRMDRLRVDGFLLAREHDPGRVQGRQVVVHVELANGERAAFPGTVVFVSPLNQAGNKFRIRAEVENRMQERNWILRPGMEATMSLR